MPVGRDSVAPWLRGPLWDLSLLAFCWVPFYVWVVLGLGLGGDLPLPRAARETLLASLALAATVVIGATFVHRHYTLLLVYGDKEIFARRARAFVVSPVVILSLVSLAQLSGLSAAWTAVAVTVVVWNVWHTIMQRYGILRAYAGRAGGGLHSREHGQRDLRLLWAMTLAVVCFVGLYRRASFRGLADAEDLLAVLAWIDATELVWLVPAATAAALLCAGVVWLRYECAAPLTLAERLPRLGFLASTVCLLAVFVIHGPVVGYLCFAMAHAVEYVAFVHLYGLGRYADDAVPPGVASTLLRSPLRTAPLLIGAMLLVYWGLLEYRSAPLYLLYYAGTSLLHFLYDGWIWQMGRPEVARPLGIAPA